MKLLNTIDIAIIFLYLAGILLFGVYLGRKQKTAEDYFLGGRKMKWWMVGMSMVVSDIGAVEFLGVAGTAYAVGISVGNFDLIGSLPPMIVAAFICIPLFWRANVYTIPEYLGERYNEFVRSLAAFLWGCFMVANLGLMLWIAARALGTLAGISPWPAVVITAAVIGIYTFFGGIKAVVYTDSLQFLIMFAGSILLLVLGIFEVGGFGALKERALSNADPNVREGYFHLVLPGDDPTFSWSSILFGLALAAAPAYWVGNQAIVQRTLGTGSEHEAKKAVLFGGVLKMLIPVLIVLPGVIALALFPGLEHQDQAYPKLVGELLPVGIKGLVFASFLAILMSSADSYLNSASTLWTMDVYHRFIKPDASQSHLYGVGRVLTALFIVLAVPLAFLAKLFGGVFEAVQSYMSFVTSPIFAILILGIVWQRSNTKGAIAGLISGVLTSVLLFWLEDLLFVSEKAFLYRFFWGLAVAFVMTIIVSLLTTPPDKEDVEPLTTNLVS